MPRGLTEMNKKNKNMMSGNSLHTKHGHELSPDGLVERKKEYIYSEEEPEYVKRKKLKVLQK